MPAVRKTHLALPVTTASACTRCRLAVLSLFCFVALLKILKLIFSQTLLIVPLHYSCVNTLWCNLRYGTECLHSYFVCNAGIIFLCCQRVKIMVGSAAKTISMTELWSNTSKNIKKKSHGDNKNIATRGWCAGHKQYSEWRWGNATSQIFPDGSRKSWSGASFWSALHGNSSTTDYLVSGEHSEHELDDFFVVVFVSVVKWEYGNMRRPLTLASANGTSIADRGRCHGRIQIHQVVWAGAVEAPHFFGRSVETPRILTRGYSVRREPLLSATNRKPRMAEIS